MRIATKLAMLAALAGCAPTKVLTVSATDPAVAHANRTGSGVYRSAFVGEGEDRIHYVETGSGPTVVLVHGFPSFWYVWFDQMEAFRVCRRMIAIDAPGANLSGKPSDPGAYRIEALANRLDRVIAELAPGEKIMLVGHDWGGALAWSYAQWKPDRIDRLAIFSAPPVNLFLQMLADDPDQRAASAYVRRLTALDRKTIEDTGMPQTLFGVAYGKQITSGVLTAAEGELFRAALADPAAIDAGIAWYRANIAAFDAIDPARAWPTAAAKARVPTLLVQGSEDRTFVARMGERARDHADPLTVETLVGVGHWTPFEDSAAANMALGEFMGLAGGKCGA